MASGKIINCDLSIATACDSSATCVVFRDGIISAIDNNASAHATDYTVDAANKPVLPGLIDCYARLREPGSTAAATIATESSAALHNGITTIMCSPDTDPVTDEPAIVEQIKQQAAKHSGTRILPTGALTSGLNGEQISEMFTLARAGCVAFSNADKPVENTQVLRRVMEYASGFKLKLIIAPQDPWLSIGVAHEGAVSARLGLAGIPSAAETVALSQLIELSYQTGAQLHFSRLSTERGVNLVAQARRDNIPVTADTGIHHLFFTDLDLLEFSGVCHTVPPFRTGRDKDALRQGIADGTIDAICSNHAPLDTDSKLRPLPETDPGTSAYDGFLSLLLKLHEETKIELSTIFECVTKGPAKCFGLQQGKLSVGSPADLIVIDPSLDWTLSSESLLSAGANNPCLDWWFQGQVCSAIVNGYLALNNHIQEAS